MVYKKKIKQQRVLTKTFLFIRSYKTYQIRHASFKYL